jgi:alkanesulfonate monooxygenase SsuD/methylene tetrahydromethanopterin reductase-like flavin-dependent oxidoreductase (luciferase family)
MARTAEAVGFDSIWCGDHLLHELPGGVSTPPVAGSPAEIAAHLDALAEAGAAHVQLVLDPITAESIEVAGRALAELRR